MSVPMWHLHLDSAQAGDVTQAREIELHDVAQERVVGVAVAARLDGVERFNHGRCPMARRRAILRRTAPWPAARTPPTVNSRKARSVPR